MKTRTPLAVAVLFTLSLAGCRGCGAPDTPQTTATPGAAATTPSAPAGGAPAAGSTVVPATPAAPVPAVLPAVVARVNGEDITRADLERSIRGVETTLRQRVPGDKRDGVVRGVLERVINYRLLLQETRTRGIEVAPAEVDAQITALARRFRTPDAMRQALIVRGLTVEMLRDDARRDLRVGKLVAAETGQDISVAESDVRKFYDANQDRFQQPESARAAHIFVRVAPGADDKAKHAMRVRAESILRLAKRGDDFAQLARNYSEDRATGTRGGDLGWFARGSTPKPFDDVVFSLDAEQIGGPAQTTDGYHIVKVMGRRPARVQPFPEVESDLATFLLREQQEQMTVSLINQLRAKSKIEILF
ncbi:MAG: peptidylprolyl isomerase [Acidobacteriota bacterium]|nr:peptidylprolyl isomerase [Acidobacteriota bacterium]